MTRRYVVFVLKKPSAVTVQVYSPWSISRISWNAKVPLATVFNRGSVFGIGTLSLTHVMFTWPWSVYISLSVHHRTRLSPFWTNNDRRESRIIAPKTVEIKCVRSIVTRSHSQAVSQSVSQSVTRSVKQSINQSISQSVSQTVRQSDSQTVSQSISQSVSLTISK